MKIGRAIRLDDDPARTIDHDELVAQAAQYLELRGWLVIVTHGKRNRPKQRGITDIIALRRTGNLLLEAKVDRDKLDPDQIEFRDRAIRRNIDVHEFRTLDEVIAIDHQIRGN